MSQEEETTSAFTEPVIQTDTESKRRDTSSKKSVLPSIFRFLVELTTWTWFLIAAFTIHVIYFAGFILSIGLLAGFNFPGDKNQEGPVNVSGPVRISIEIFSGLLGIFAAWMLFGMTGFYFQIGLTLIAFALDYERWSWFLGRRSDPPESVTRTRK